MLTDEELDALAERFRALGADVARGEIGLAIRFGGHDLAYLWSTFAHRVVVRDLTVFKAPVQHFEDVPEWLFDNVREACIGHARVLLEDV